MSDGLRSFEEYKESMRRRRQLQQASAQNRGPSLPPDEDVVMVDAPPLPLFSDSVPAPVPAPSAESDEDFARRLQAEEYSMAESAARPTEAPFRVLRPGSGSASSFGPTLLFDDIPDDFAVSTRREMDERSAFLRALMSGGGPLGTRSSSSRATSSSSRASSTMPSMSSSSRSRRAERRAEIERLMEAMLAEPMGFGGPIPTPFGMMMGGFGRDGLFEHFMGSAVPDIDNMSYEELLELEERLGAVKPKGAASSEISRLPTETFKPAEEVKIDLTEDTPKESTSSGHKEQCSICMEEFESGDKLRRLPCFHAFHQACADKWLGINKVCPICRIPIDKGSTTS